MPKVWSTTEYHCDLYFPLEGLGNCWVDLGGVPACQELVSAWWLSGTSLGGADKVLMCLARRPAPRGKPRAEISVSVSDITCQK